LSEEKKQALPRIKAEIVKFAKRAQPVRKADAATQLSEEEVYGASEWLTPAFEPKGLALMVDESTILPQCVRAYKSNIAGFGIELRYRDEFLDEDETTEMKAEWDRAQEILDLLNTEQECKEVFEDIIEARETYGCAYLEVIRNLAGEVTQIEFIRDTPSVRKTRMLDPYVEVQYFYKDRFVPRKRRFRKYKQSVGAKTVYYKEFGDPRVMDSRTGAYAESVELQYQANEIMEFAIGTAAYGKVRWLGQILSVDGARRAETLNNNYFINGRHTPLMIMVQGGSLTDESYAKLREYMEEIKGESGQHAFMVLEVENADRTGLNSDNIPTVEVKDLAAILQQDELFQSYLDNTRRKVQSAFQLPDLYVAYTTDFNRATAQTAMEVTEKQVFQPERRSLAWAINNRLLNGYQFKYVEVFFREPDITNPDDLYKILTVCNNAGGLTPNKAKAIIYEMLGETAEDFEEEWGDIPVAVAKVQSAAKVTDMAGNTPSVAQNGTDGNMRGNTPPGQNPAQNGAQEPPAGGSVEAQLDAQIEKAAAANEGELVAVMKEVRRLLIQLDRGQDDVP